MDSARTLSLVLRVLCIGVQDGTAFSRLHTHSLCCLYTFAHADTQERIGSLPNVHPSTSVSAGKKRNSLTMSKVSTGKKRKFSGKAIDTSPSQSSGFGSGKGPVASLWSNKMEVFSPKTVLRNAENNIKEENPDMLKDIVGFKHDGNLPHLRNPSMVSDADSSKEAKNVRGRDDFWCC